MRTKLQRQWGEVRAAAVPLAAVAAVGLVVLLLGFIVEERSVEIPRPDFSALLLKEYPLVRDLELAAQIIRALMWWLCFTVLLWVAGLVSIGACLWMLREATATDEHAGRRIVRVLVMAIAGVVMVLAYLSLVRHTPLMSFSHAVAVLGVVSASLPRLATLNTALGVVVGTTLLLAISLTLLPAVHRGDPSRQMRLLTRLMYVAAVYLFLWISTATAMYRLAATLLEQPARKPMLELAPTVSLMGGLFASLLLAAAYVSSALWLQRCHERRRLMGHRDAPQDVMPSPGAIFAAHWPKVLAVLMPILPGAMASTVQALTHAP